MLKNAGIWECVLTSRLYISKEIRIQASVDLFRRLIDKVGGTLHILELGFGLPSEAAAFLRRVSIPHTFSELSIQMASGGDSLDELLQFVDVVRDVKEGARIFFDVCQIPISDILSKTLEVG